MIRYCYTYSMLTISKQKEKMKGIVALIALAFTFAALGLFARFLNTEFSIVQQVYLRIGAAFLLGLVLFKNEMHFEKLKKIKVKEWSILLVRAVCLYVLGVTLL